MKKLMLKFLFLFALTVGSLLFSQSTHAYTNSRLIDNQVFDNTNAMSETAIRNFINQRPGTCLVTSGAIFPEPITYWEYGGNVDAARVIYKAAQYSGVNPQVIIATLQKEQSLITDTDCNDPQGVPSLPKAMGMGCPDGGACPAEPYRGFEKQVMKGTWLLAFGRHRAEGNVGWGENDSVTYSGPMTRGTYKRCGGCALIYYDGYRTIDGQSVYMENGATATMYNYTPHLGQSFPGIFEGWFGFTTSDFRQWSVDSFTSDKDLSALNAGTTARVTVKAKNTGSTTWYNFTNTPVRIATWQPENHSSPYMAAGWINPSRPANLQESSVSPGGIGTFSFDVKAPDSGGSFTDRFSLVEENYTWFNDPGFVINVTSIARWSWAVESLTPNRDLNTIPSGQAASVILRARNTGTTTWHNSSSTPLRLGTANPNDHSGQLYAPNWLSSTRPALLAESSVAPGQIGTFNFDVKAPSTPGNYTERFNLVADGYTWLQDPNFSISLTSVGDVWAWAVDSQTMDKDLNQMRIGDKARVTLKAKNTGSTTWYNSGGSPVKLGTTQTTNHESPYFTTGWLSNSRPALLAEASVTPGGVGTFSFDVVAPSTGVSFNEHFSLVAENYIWLNDPGFVLNMRVTNYWGWSIESQTSDKDLTALPSGFTARIVLRARNTSSNPWYNHGGSPVRLATTQAQNHASPFATGSWLNTSRPANLSEASVPSGGIGTFSFDVQAPAAGQTYVEHFSLVSENVAWLNDPDFTVTITPVSAWQWQIQSYTSSKDLTKLPTGSTSRINLVARNNGATTWHNSGGTPVRLGTVAPQNHASVLAANNWINSSRPAQLVDAFVPPGGLGTFSFDIKAPDTKATYTDYFSLVAENYTWLNDPGFSLVVTTVSPLGWEVVSQSTSQNLAAMTPNQVAQVTLRAKNIGSIPWNNHGSNITRLGTSNPYNSSSQFATSNWFSPSRPATLSEASVEPGQTGTFIFEVKAPTTPGNYSDKFDIVKESYAWLEDIGYSIDITVVAP